MSAEPSATPGRPVEHRFLGSRLSAMMFIQWAMYGVWAPLIGQFLLADVRQGGLGFSQQQLGWILGVSGTVGALLAPFVGGQVGDRYVATERLLALLLAIGGGIQFILAGQTGFAAWLALSIASGVALGPSGALSNSLAFAHLDDPRRQFPRVRLWGTIGWIVPAWVFPMVWLQTGLHFTWKPPFLVGLERPDVTCRLADALRVGAVVAFAYAAYCLTLPHTPPKREARERLAFRKAFRLFRRPSFAVLIGAGILIASIHSLYFTQAGRFLVTRGLRQADILPAMSIGQIAEIGVMALVGVMLKRLGFRAVLSIGASAYVLRFLLFGTTSLPLGVLVVSQALHGVCFACYYAAAFIYIDRLAEEDIRHSVQTVFGILLAIGPIVGGWLNGRLAALYTDWELRPLPWPFRQAIPFPLYVGRLDYSPFFYTAAAIGLIATFVLVALFRDETGQAKRAAAADPGR